MTLGYLLDEQTFVPFDGEFLAGLTVLEAQACGIPAIVTDFTADGQGHADDGQPLAAGRIVDGQLVPLPVAWETAQIVGREEELALLREVVLSGTLNAAYNCIDRHLPKRAKQTAIIWEGDDPKDDKKITYRELHAEVCRFANVLKAEGVVKGDRVAGYLPNMPETLVAMLATASLGPSAADDPMLVFNMSIFNSAKSWECIFNPLPQRENVWA